MSLNVVRKKFDGLEILGNISVVGMEARYHSLVQF